MKLTIWKNSTKNKHYRQKEWYLFTLCFYPRFGYEMTLLLFRFRFLPSLLIILPSVSPPCSFELIMWWNKGRNICELLYTLQLWADCEFPQFLQHPGGGIRSYSTTEFHYQIGFYLNDAFVTGKIRKLKARQLNYHFALWFCFVSLSLLYINLSF